MHIISCLSRVNPAPFASCVWPPLCTVAVPGAIAIFWLDNHKDVEEAMHGVEWDTLLFFGALFVMVEGFAEMGLMRAIAGSLADLILSFEVQSRQPVAIVLISFVSAITSAFIDNIPFTTTM